MYKVFKKIGLLVFSCIVSFAAFAMEEEGEYYFPDTDKIAKRSNFSIIKNAVYLNETNRDILPKNVLIQTKAFIQREELLRQNYQISPDTNIAQFSLIVIYEDDTSSVFEALPKNCNAIFYMSGNQVTNFSQNKKPTQGFLDRQNIAWKSQNISEEKGGYASIIQRTQPILESVKPCVEFLMNISAHIDNTNEFHKILSEQARYKYMQILAIEKERDVFCEDLSKTLIKEKLSTGKMEETCEVNYLTGGLEFKETEIFSFEEPKNPFDLFTNKIKEEIIGSLRQNDFTFSLIYKNINGILFDYLLTETVPKNLSQKNISETLNSKHFNLGCSEQLLLFDIFESTEAVKKMKNNLDKCIDKHKKLKSIYTQIHSTKTPCKTCLLSACVHLTSGWVAKFNSEFTKKFSVPILTVISYNKEYEDKYEFGIQIATNKIYSEKDIILLNSIK